MKCVFFAGFLFLMNVSYAQSEMDSLFQKLSETVENRETFVSQKKDRVETLRQSLDRKSLTDQYEIISSIYDEYKSFVYDSAFLYVRKLQHVASLTQNPALISDSKIKCGFILVSSGLFNEALDTLRKIRTYRLPDSLKIDYYYLMARTCYDLADFSRDNFYGEQYAERASRFIDSAGVYLNENDVEFYILRGLKLLHVHNMSAAKDAYETMIRKFKLTDHEYAVAASTLSFIYFFSGDRDKSKEMLITAAIADIQSGTRETLATMKLAEMLFDEGDISNAYKYIKIANQDAKDYGARQRQVQVAAIYPVIEARHLGIEQSKRKMLLVYSSLITLLTVSVIGFSIVIYKQNKKLQVARKIISQANDSLTETNHQLQDANKIKEEYIWYYFNTTAEYITKLDALKKTLELKLMTKKLEDLKFAVDNINIKRERDELYHNFDRIFLKLFPDFVTVFNSFFKDEDRIVPKEGQLLNTELRIFALIRMGIHDHERIAKILDYSVTTIYTYKTRIRNKSMLENDEFDRRIMAIRAI